MTLEEIQAMRARHERARTTLQKTAPPSSYVVLMWEDDMTRDRDFSRRAKNGSGFIAHYMTRELDGDPEEMRVVVCRPNGGIQGNGFGEITYANIRKVCDAKAVELVEYPAEDAAALRALKKRIDKDIKELTKGRAL